MNIKWNETKKEEEVRKTIKTTVPEESDNKCKQWNNENVEQFIFGFFFS